MLDRRPKRILVADDTLPMRIMLQDVLLEAGYEVVTAADGQEAWNLLREEGKNFDLLILDLLMAPKATPEGDVVRSVRLTDQDLAIPQLQGEPSAVRGFQRLVATVLKATGATPYPSRDDCLGLRGFPAFPDVGAYETALLACVRLAGN